MERDRPADAGGLHRTGRAAPPASSSQAEPGYWLCITRRRRSAAQW
ncbi:hypothetical protein AB5I41_19940 [Sphingomonas sp. MMS24-JH45]